MPDPNKFLCAQFKSRSGSSLGNGLMRPLAWYWSAIVFNREWMLEVAQKYGSMFLDMTYKPGTPQAEVDKMNSFLNKAAIRGWMTHVEGSVINVTPAAAMGPDNPQVHIIKAADEACQLLLLGQTATTSPTPGKLGNDQSHMEVKREHIERIAKWISPSVLTNQFSRAIVRVNYFGTQNPFAVVTEIPSVDADFTEATDPLTEAQRDQIFLTAEVPLGEEEFYKRHNLAMPEPDDRVIVGGKVGTMDEIKQEAADALAAQQQPKLDANGKPMTQPQDDPLRKAVAKASTEDVQELHRLIVAAKQAKHMNGELEAVEIKIKQIKKGAYARS
jgi:phage gp29-like protein